MIRVAVNLAWLVPGRVGGSEEYSVRLLSAAIDAAPADLELSLLGSPAVFDAHPTLGRAACVEIDGPMGVRPWRILSESTRVHRATRGADVVHHFGGRVPARHHGRDIVTIHDLQPLQFPENFSWAKRRYLARALPRSVEAARLVVTPSEWVRSTVIDLLGADPARVRAVPSTWDAAVDIDTSLADQMPPGPIVLYPAMTHPHKRHTLLIEAMNGVAAVRDDVTLVLTGGAGRADADVERAAAGAGARIVRPGRVSAAALRGLSQRASLLAFPSAYEGFGLPVLEAMRIGLPVVASNSTALPEVLGDVGTLVRSDDPAAWTAAILATLDDDLDSRAAQARAEQWSPTAAGARLIDAWRSVAAG